VYAGLTESAYMIFHKGFKNDWYRAPCFLNVNVNVINNDGDENEDGLNKCVIIKLSISEGFERVPYISIHGLMKECKVYIIIAYTI